VNLYNERKKKHIEEKEIMQQQFTNQLLQSQVETQEETLSALGKELHDNIGQLLNSTKLLIGVTQRTITRSAGYACELPTKRWAPPLMSCGLYQNR
jgi:signal transduction histidine kinase